MDIFHFLSEDLLKSLATN